VEDVVGMICGSDRWDFSQKCKSGRSDWWIAERGANYSDDDELQRSCVKWDDSERY